MSLKKAVVIVDDEAILLLSMRQELRFQFGPDILYETALSAEAGLDALKRLDEGGVSVAVLVSDWLLPGMKGDQFLRIVRGQHPEMKLILLSGHAERSDMDTLGKEIGLYAALNKPYRAQELHELIGAALG